MFCTDSFKSGQNKGRFIFKIIGYAFLGIMAAVIFAFIFSVLVMYIWNHLITDIFGLKTITFWQAFLLIILAKLLFGHFGPHSKHPHEHIERKLKNKFYKDFHPELNNEERKKYYEHYKNFWEEEGKKAFDEYVKKQEK
ncbi:MAG: hypothetical protein JXB50_03125 [Spirochaetes bacterium]|nr:hypothetical protein [Spirochaetota bacterium]